VITWCQGGVIASDSDNEREDALINDEDDDVDLDDVTTLCGSFSDFGEIIVIDGAADFDEDSDSDGAGVLTTVKIAFDEEAFQEKSSDEMKIAQSDGQDF
jgi:hypothetical protein